jgi:hypothetical protein
MAIPAPDHGYRGLLALERFHLDWKRKQQPVGTSSPRTARSAGICLHLR